MFTRWRINRAAARAAQAGPVAGRVQAVSTLERYAGRGDGEAVRHLAELLLQPRLAWELVAPVAEALGRSGQPAATEALVAALAADHPDVRHHAARLLRSANWQPATPREDASLAVAEQRWSDALAFGREAEPLLRALNWGRMSQAAVTAFAATRHPLAWRVLGEALTSDDQTSVGQARDAILAHLDRAVPTADLAALLNDLPDAALPVFAKSLTAPEWATRQRVLALLRHRDWQPNTPEQRVMLAVAEERWQDALAGDPAVLPDVLTIGAGNPELIDHVVASVAAVGQPRPDNARLYLQVLADMAGVGLLLGMKSRDAAEQSAREVLLRVSRLSMVWSDLVSKVQAEQAGIELEASRPLPETRGPIVTAGGSLGTPMPPRRP